MVNFPTSLDSFTNPTATDATNSVTVPHATQHANLNDAVEALEAKVGADNSAVTSSLDYQIRQKQGVCEEKTTSFTAAVHGNYVVTGTATVTDPTPEAGHGFTVLVRNGTVTVGGTAYSVVGTRIERTYHSGAWANSVWYPVTGGEGTATHVLTSNGAGVAPSFQAAAAGGSAFEVELYPGYNGITLSGYLGEFTATTGKTLAEVSIKCDDVITGTNATVELRKNSTSSGNILSSTLQIATTDTKTNGRVKGTSVTSFTSASIADGDTLFAYGTWTDSSMTIPPSNVRVILRFSA